MERQDDLEADVEAAAEQAESSVEEMEAQSQKVAEHVDETRSDWERKQADPSVPGADAGGESEAEPVAGDWEGEGPAANQAGQ